MTDKTRIVGRVRNNQLLDMSLSYYDQPEIQSPNMIVAFDLPHHAGGMYRVLVIDTMLIPALKPWPQTHEMLMHFYCVCYALTPCPAKSARIIQLEKAHMRKTFQSDAVIRSVDGAYIAIKASYSAEANIAAVPVTRSQL